MLKGKMIFVAAALLLLAVCGYATESAFMGFDVTTQKMYAVVVGEAPFHAQITYSQSNPDGWVGPSTTYQPDVVETWGEAPLSPTDPDRYTDLPDNAINIITAFVDIYDENDVYQYTLTATDTLLANVEQGNGFYTYTDGDCTPIMPDSIRINTAFCAWVCHGSFTIPIVCEDPGYNPDLLEVTVTNGCDPAETHCNDATCPRVEWSQFRWFKRVFAGCHLYLTMTYCNAAPGCVCIWRSDFTLPVEMIGFDAVAGDGNVTLNWASASESGTERFIVTRADTRDGIYHTVHSLPAAGTSNTRQNYTWTDTDVVNGHTYFYKLHVRDINGTHVYNVGGETVIAAATPGVGNGGVPTDYSVKNYPNPFNSNTTFSFSIPTSDRVTLKVYDLLGREVATVVDRYMTASTYNVNWSAEGLATGVYMYTLKSGTFSYTNKLLYLK